MTKLIDCFIVKPVFIREYYRSLGYLCKKGRMNKHCLWSSLKFRSEFIFESKLIPFMKKMFPKKEWEKKDFVGSTRPVFFSVCELNELYDAIGMKGENVCDADE